MGQFYLKAVERVEISRDDDLNEAVYYQEKKTPIYGGLI